MADLRGFNAADIDPQGDFEAIPAGEYLACITESQFKPTKAGTGEYLELKLQVLEGEYKNRLLWDRLNLKNPNKTAVRIAQQALSAICHAVNVLTPNDSTELHNLPMVVRVACRKREDTGDITNEIKGYKSREQQQSVQSPSGSDNTTAPWRK